MTIIKFSNRVNMKLSEVLIKPIVTEKSNKLSESSRTYAFHVARKANKLEIKKAIEEFYGVTVIRCKYSGCSRKSKITVHQSRSYLWP